MLIACFIMFATQEAASQFTQTSTIIYSTTLASLFFLAIVSLVKTFSTHPGEVTQQLLDRLKSQLMHPKQIERLYDIGGQKNRQEYILKCLNRAIMRHI